MVKYALLWYSGLCRLKIWWLTWVRLGTKGLKYPLCTWMQLRFYCLDPQKQKAFCPTEKTSIAFIYWLANFPARIKKVYRLWTRGDSVDSSIIVFFSSVFCNNIRLVSDTRRKRSESSPPRRPDRPERRRRLPTEEASDLLRLIHAAVNQPRSDTNKEEARSVCCRGRFTVIQIVFLISHFTTRYAAAAAVVLLEGGSCEAMHIILSIYRMTRMKVGGRTSAGFKVTSRSECRQQQVFDKQSSKICRFYGASLLKLASNFYLSRKSTEFSSVRKKPAFVWLLTWFMTSVNSFLVSSWSQSLVSSLLQHKMMLIL